MNMNSKHGEDRLQQRGIPLLALQLLECYGSTMRCGKADRLFFDKAARRRLALDLGGERGIRLIERWLNSYAVIGDDGRLVTASHRRRRFRRP